MSNLSFLMAIGPNQVVLILVIVVLLFGAKKIPELMKGIGQGMKEFKDSQKDPSKENIEKK
jgi:sec-independent protein translocase protein TatA